jgi:ATP phosphoribosyltransferase regulatory subunit HisZ
MKLLVSGSRTVTAAQAHLVCEVIVELVTAAGASDVEMLVGDAQGVDAVARALAQQKGWKLQVFHARWQVHGTRAGPLRNTEMLDKVPDQVVAFPSKQSLGTRDVIRKAQQRKLPLRVVELDIAMRPKRKRSPD